MEQLLLLCSLLLFLASTLLTVISVKDGNYGSKRGNVGDIDKTRTIKNTKLKVQPINIFYKDEVNERPPIGIIVYRLKAGSEEGVYKGIYNEKGKFIRREFPPF